jgi:hypothetical protein
MLKTIKLLDKIVKEDDWIQDKLAHFYDIEGLTNMTDKFREAMKDRKVEPHETLTSLCNSMRLLKNMIVSVAQKDIEIANSIVTMNCECMKRADKILDHIIEKTMKEPESSSEEETACAGAVSDLTTKEKRLIKYCKGLYFSYDEIKGFLNILPLYEEKLLKHYDQIKECGTKTVLIDTKEEKKE